jgi:hypothetical protein
MMRYKAKFTTIIDGIVFHDLNKREWRQSRWPSLLNLVVIGKPEPCLTRVHTAERGQLAEAV